MADYSRWETCSVCGSQYSYYTGCTKCRREQEHKRKLDEMRPIVLQILREEGIIDD